MRIAFIGQKGIPAVWGGVEEHVDHLSLELVKAGFDVDVYVRSWYTPSRLKDYQGVHLIHVPTLKTKHLDAAAHSLLGTLHALARGTDILHYHGIGPAAFALLPRLLGRMSVVTFHARDWQAGKWGPFARTVLKACEVLAVRVPRRTIVLSKTMNKELRLRYGVETTVIPHGASAPVFGPPGSSANSIGSSRGATPSTWAAWSPKRGPAG